MRGRGEEKKEETHFYTDRCRGCQRPQCRYAQHCQEDLQSGKTQISRAVHVEQKSSPYVDTHGRAFRSHQRVSMTKTATGVGDVHRCHLRNMSFAKDWFLSTYGDVCIPLSCIHFTKFINSHKTEEVEGKGTGPRK